MNKMSSGDMTEFEACFTFACPKFLSAIPPSLEEPPTAAGEALHKEPLRLQMKVFMDEVKQQMLLPTVRSYLKLYTSMPLEKLADYMSITVDELEGHLGARGRLPVRVRSGLLHRQEHDPHRRHEGGPQVRRLLHPANPQVRGAAPHSQETEDVESM